MATLAETASIPVQTQPIAPPKDRVETVDIWRGVVMVLMALDHVRDFFMAQYFDPLNLAHTTAPLFFTRWITHFCAPGFIFLAGTGAYLSFSRGKQLSRLSTFLITRGLWIVFLEFTIVGFGWSFIPGFGYGGVLWCIGWSMVVLAAIVWLPTPAIAALGLGMILTHNLLDHIQPIQFGKMAWAWFILHHPGMYPVYRYPLFIQYVLVPWTGVMAAGFAFGALLKRPQPERRRLMLIMGCASLLFFTALRATNLYGNGYAETGFTIASGPWTVQKSALFTFMSFVNVEKYPPSLLYLALTLGVAMVAMGLNDRPAGPIGRFFSVFGRVPMFYYIAHIYLVHLMAIAIAAIRHQPYRWMLHGGFFMNPPPPGYGTSLLGVYLAWICAIALLYWPCKWFGEVKARRRNAWLSYV